MRVTRQLNESWSIFGGGGKKHSRVRILSDEEYESVMATNQWKLYKSERELDLMPGDYPQTQQDAILAALRFVYMHGRDAAVYYNNGTRKWHVLLTKRKNVQPTGIPPGRRYVAHSDLKSAIAELSKDVYDENRPDDDFQFFKDEWVWVGHVRKTPPKGSGRKSVIRNPKNQAAKWR